MTAFRLLLASPGAPIPPRTLGIEVPPELAAQCDLGNLSGSHGSTILPISIGAKAGLWTGHPAGWSGRAAVDIATEVPLPPDGATILFDGEITLPKVAAAAVLVLRALGLWPTRRELCTHAGTPMDACRWCREDLELTPPMQRVRRIAARATRSAEWSPRPLPTVQDPWGELLVCCGKHLVCDTGQRLCCDERVPASQPRAPHEDRELAPVAAICAAPASTTLSPGSTWVWTSDPSAGPPGGTAVHVIRRVANEPAGVEVRECGSEARRLWSARWTDGLAYAHDGPCSACGFSGGSSAGLSLAERVAAVACWLLWGEPHDWPPSFQIARHRGDIWQACGLRDTGEHPAHVLLRARERVEASRRALAEEAQREGEIGAVWLHEGRPIASAFPKQFDAFSADYGTPRLAIVRSAHPGALELGWHVASVVVWMREQVRAWGRSDGQRVAVAVADSGQVTIAGWPGPDGRTRYLDIDALYLRLHALEWHAAEGILANAPGLWVGQDNVIRTGVATLLPEETIVREVVGCLL